MEQAQTDPGSTVTSQTVQAWLCKAVTMKIKKSPLRTLDNLNSRILYLAYFQYSRRTFEVRISGAPVQHLLFPFPSPLPIPTTRLAWLHATLNWQFFLFALESKFKKQPCVSWIERQGGDLNQLGNSEVGNACL